jgi:hypothetical protein
MFLAKNISLFAAANAIFVVKDSSGKWKWKLQGDGRQKQGRD